MLTRFPNFLVVGALLLLSVSPLFAAPSVSVAPSGNGVFVIHGNGLDNVSGIDLVVNFDPSSLSAPSVSQGSLIASSGAMFAANPNYASGKIKIGIISTKSLPSSGPIATISFATHKGAGTVTVSSGFVNSTGASLAGGGDATGTDSTAPAADNQAQNQTQNQTQNQNLNQNLNQGGGTTIPSTLGTVTMPSDSQPQKETKATEPASEPAPTPAAPSTPPAPPEEQTASLKPEEAKKTENAKVTTYGSIVERFRAYQGEKSPAILVALFKKEIAPTIHQDPAVALSDGVTSLKVVVALSSTDSKSPNFALNGAKLVSLKKDDEADKWIIEAMPQANTLNAGLTILNGSEIIEFPLTVAPPIKSRTISDGDFAAFLKSPGKDSDLNNDRKYDYLDDYIYTANYLVWLDKSKADKKPQEPAK